MGYFFFPPVYTLFDYIFPGNRSGWSSNPKSNVPRKLYWFDDRSGARVNRKSICSWLNESFSFFFFFFFLFFKNFFLFIFFFFFFFFLIRREIVDLFSFFFFPAVLNRKIGRRLEIGLFSCFVDRFIGSLNDWYIFVRNWMSRGDYSYFYSYFLYKRHSKNIL